MIKLGIGYLPFFAATCTAALGVVLVDDELSCLIGGFGCGETLIGIGDGSGGGVISGSFFFI